MLPEDVSSGIGVASQKIHVTAANFLGLEDVNLSPLFSGVLALNPVGASQDSLRTVPAKLTFDRIAYLLIAVLAQSVA